MTSSFDLVLKDTAALPASTSGFEGDERCPFVQTSFEVRPLGGAVAAIAAGSGQNDSWALVRNPTRACCYLVRHQPSLTAVAVTVEMSKVAADEAGASVDGLAVCAGSSEQGGPWA